MCLPSFQHTCTSCGSSSPAFLPWFLAHRLPPQTSSCLGQKLYLFFFFFLNYYLFIYFYFWLCWVFVFVFCARAFSSCGKRGPRFIAVRGPLTIVASLVVEHRLQTRRLSSCGSRAQLLRGMRDLPRPGLEPVSPASAGRFSTTAPSGKPQKLHFSSMCSRHWPALST